MGKFFQIKKAIDRMKFEWNRYWQWYSLHINIIFRQAIPAQENSYFGSRDCRLFINQTEEKSLYCKSFALYVVLCDLNFVVDI